MGAVAEEAFLSEDIESIANVLEMSFYDNFAEKASTRSTHRQRPMPNGIATELGQSPSQPSSILSLLTYDLVGLSTNQYGSLGCSHVEEGGAAFFLSGMDSDETPAMFDNTPPATINPVTEYGQRQQTQLIDVWYSSHPLSFIVSKTLLLRELRDGTHDEVLLAVIMAEANFTIGGDTANTRGRALLQYAQSQLRHRPLRTTRNSGVATDPGTVVYSGISTRIFSGIATVQALMLLGWNSMTESQFRRAITYIQLAGRLATDVKEQAMATRGMQLSSRINGIDVYDVEKELIDYLYWTTYSLTLWVYVQTGRCYFSSPSPTVLTSIFIPPTTDVSASIQLDLVSENVNTLQKQKLSVEEMWPLSHIAISVAHACGFHPQQQGAASLNIMQRCHDTNRFLMESTHELNKKGINVVSTGFILIIYHTLAIQFLFPALNGQEVARPDIIECLCYSVEEILQVFGLVSTPPKDPMNTAPSLQSSLPAVFGLALDTCSRALRAIRGKRQSSGIVTEFPSAQVYAQTLQIMTTRLYLTSKSDFLNQSSRLRAIRKQLRSSMLGISSSGSTSPGNSSGSESGSSTMSPTSSDDLSAATTPEMDVHSPFITPKKERRTVSPRRAADDVFNDAANMPKQSWRSTAAAATHAAAPQELMFNPMDANALGIQSRDELSLSGMVDLQHAWLPQMQPLTEADMGGIQWDWGAQNMKQEVTVAPAAVWSDMDMVL